MFDNIIGRSKLTQHLQDLIHSHTFPQSSILVGDAKSGKQTLAIEIARALLCEKQGDWNCNCSQCIHSLALTHPNIICMGNTNGINEVRCGQAMILQRPQKRELMFFTRAIFKILRRADALIWESTDVWKRSLSNVSMKTREMIIEYQENEQYWYNAKFINSIVQQVEKLMGEFPVQMLPVQCIRNIISWSMIKSPMLAKVIIISHVESMLPASANSLLKVLEEPPKDVYFILLTNNPQAVINTIRTRTREFLLPNRTEQEELEMLNTIFKIDIQENPSIKNIQQYLFSFSNNSKEKNKDIETSLENMAEKYFDAILRQHDFSLDYINFPNRKDVRNQSLGLLDCLRNHIKLLLDDSTISIQLLQDFWRLVEEARKDIMIRNINASNILEMLYYELIQKYAVYNQGQQAII